MKTVLIVDDVQTNRDIMGKIVSAAGHHPEYASSGDEGFLKAKQLKPSLILLDVVMPGTDGFATCRKLKKDPETTAIPIAIVSTKNTESDKFWAQKQGANDYVIKPFQNEEIEVLFKRYLRA